MIADISGRIHYVNLLTDSGTVLGFNAFHAVLVDPNSVDVLLSLDTDEIPAIFHVQRPDCGKIF
jgi:hypothetical protein